MCSYKGSHVVFLPDTDGDDTTSVTSQHTADSGIWAAGGTGTRIFGDMVSMNIVSQCGYEDWLRVGMNIVSQSAYEDWL